MEAMKGCRVGDGREVCGRSHGVGRAYVFDRNDVKGLGVGGRTEMVAYSGSHLWLSQDFFSITPSPTSLILL